MAILSVPDGKAVVADLAGLADVAPSVVAEPVKRATLELQRLVRLGASTGTHKPGLPHIPGTGPGPNVATGNYRRSVTVSTALVPAAGGGVAPIGRVWTNMPQAWRLEYGFVGQDALGRTYHQRPYPHWGPAVEKVEPMFVAELEDAVEKALGRP